MIESSPIALSVVFNSTLYHSIFSGGWYMIRNVVFLPSAMLFGPHVYEIVLEISFIF